MRYASVAQTSASMLRGPRARKRAVLATSARHLAPQRRDPEKAPSVQDLLDDSDHVRTVYHEVPASRLAG